MRFLQKALTFSIVGTIAGLLSCDRLLASEPASFHRIPQAQVPKPVVSEFKRNFLINGAIMSSIQDNCFKGDEFQGLDGWYTSSPKVDEADRLNGIISKNVYLFKTRFIKDTITRRWEPISNSYSAQGGSPFVVVFERHRDASKVQSAIFCL